jgi:hypothetical protein
MSELVTPQRKRPTTQARALLATLGVILTAALAACSSGATSATTAASSAESSTPSSTPSNTASSAASGSTATSSSTSAITVSITGGLQTVAGDNGRPIVLVAAMLGVAPAVFRTAFSGVHPAGPDQGPTVEQAQANKAALLSVLGPYGITNEQLDQASNAYRYNASAGQMWAHTSATATAIVANGTVTAVKVTNGGAGYTSAPTITLSNGQPATATLEYGKDAATNGSITTITLN